MLRSARSRDTIARPMGLTHGASRCSSTEEIRDAYTVEASAQGVGSVLPATCSPPRGGWSVPETDTARPMQGGVDRAGSAGLAARAHQAPRPVSYKLPMREFFWAGPRGPALFHGDSAGDTQGDTVSPRTLLNRRSHSALLRNIKTRRRNTTKPDSISNSSAFCAPRTPEEDFRRAGEMRGTIHSISEDTERQNHLSWLLLRVSRPGGHHATQVTAQPALGRGRRPRRLLLPRRTRGLFGRGAGQHRAVQARRRGHIQQPSRPQTPRPGGRPSGPDAGREHRRASGRTSRGALSRSRFRA